MQTCKYLQSKHFTALTGNGVGILIKQVEWKLPERADYWFSTQHCQSGKIAVYAVGSFPI